MGASNSKVANLLCLAMHVLAACVILFICLGSKVAILLYFYKFVNPEYLGLKQVL